MLYTTLLSSKPTCFIFHSYSKCMHSIIYIHRNIIQTTILEWKLFACYSLVFVGFHLQFKETRMHGSEMQDLHLAYNVPVFGYIIIIRVLTFDPRPLHILYIYSYIFLFLLFSSIMIRSWNLNMVSGGGRLISQMISDQEKVGKVCKARVT